MVSKLSETERERRKERKRGREERKRGRWWQREKEGEEGIEVAGRIDGEHERERGGNREGKRERGTERELLVLEQLPEHRSGYQLLCSQTGQALEELIVLFPAVAEWE